MRTIKLIFIIPCMLFIFSACQKDNYSGPNAGISGALTDNQVGGPLQLSQAGSNSTVRMIVFDPAKYAAPSNLDLTCFADGTFKNTRIFAETYKITPLYQSGPWAYPSANPAHTAGDTTIMAVGANQSNTISFKVNPFFYISTPVVVDSMVTFTVTKSTSTWPQVVNDNLTSSNNCEILVNNYPIVNESISSNTTGKYYQNQFQYTITNAALGVPQTPIYPGTNAHSNTPYASSIPWQLTHLPKGNYYLRVAVLGAGSNGKWNYSPTVAFTIH